MKDLKSLFELILSVDQRSIQLFVVVIAILLILGNDTIIKGIKRVLKCFNYIFSVDLQQPAIPKKKRIYGCYSMIVCYGSLMFYFYLLGLTTLSLTLIRMDGGLKQILQYFVSIGLLLLGSRYQLFVKKELSDLKQIKKNYI